MNERIMADTYTACIPSEVAEMGIPEKFDIDWFLLKYDRVPRNRFCVGSYRQMMPRKNSTDRIEYKYCMLGMCGVSPTSAGNASEVLALRNIFIELGKIFDISCLYPHTINDGLVMDKFLDTELEHVAKLHHPKDRIIEALKLAKRKKSEGKVSNGNA